MAQRLGISALGPWDRDPSCGCAAKLDGGRPAASADHYGHPKCGANAQADRSVCPAGPAVSDPAPAVRATNQRCHLARLTDLEPGARHHAGYDGPGEPGPGQSDAHLSPAVQGPERLAA